MAEIVEYKVNKEGLFITIKLSHQEVKEAVGHFDFAYVFQHFEPIRFFGDVVRLLRKRAEGTPVEPATEGAR